MVTSPEVKLRRSGQHLENQYNIYISFEDGPISKKFDSLMQSVHWHWVSEDTQSGPRICHITSRLLQLSPGSFTDDNHWQASTGPELCCTSDHCDWEVRPSSVTTHLFVCSSVRLSPTRSCRALADWRRMLLLSDTGTPGQCPVCLFRVKKVLVKVMLGAGAYQRRP